MYNLLNEANYCLLCKNARCKKNCPISTPIPEIISLYKENKFEEAGKILFIFPKFMLRAIQPVPDPENPLMIEYFNPCLVETDIVVGHSKITLEDVKNLEMEDIIILEKSNLHEMTLKSTESLRININPNPSLIMNLDEEDGDEAVNELNKISGSIWDSLEVDISAEFGYLFHNF